MLSQVDFRALLDDCVEGVYLVDTAGVGLYANPAVAHLLGYDTADLVGADFHDRVHHSRPDGSPLAWTECPMYRAAVHGVEGELDDDVLWRADGTPLAVDYRARPLHAEGRVIGAVVTFYDASQRRAVAAELEGILATAGDAFVGVDHDGVIARWNVAAESLLGWTAEEVLGRSLMDTVVPQRLRDRYRTKFQALQDLDEAALPPDPVDMIARDRSGREIALELTIGRMRWDGEWRFHSFLRDVTAQRAASRSLESSETLHRHLTEVSSDLISRHAPDGVTLYVSPAATEVLGIPPEELIGRNSLELVHPDDLTAILGPEGAMSDLADRAVMTFRLRHGDGHWVWVEGVPSLLRDSEGTVTEVQLSSRDITERKVREAEIEQAQRLEALGRLSAGLAHEINSPIQYVGDNARFLAEAYEELLTLVSRYHELIHSTEPMPWVDRLEKIQEAESGIEFEYLQREVPVAVDQTLAGIDRVATIVRAMKTFSHPGDKEPVPADLSEALMATVTVTRPQVTGVADLEMELADLPSVRCSVGDINQVFLNLIVNAADAIEETGKRGTIRLTTAVDGGDVIIRIGDTGPGIPDDVFPKIFDPFFTTKEVGRGSGQGLPLARAVIEKGHGGTLTVESRPGHGTTFTVRLPIEGPGRSVGRPEAMNRPRTATTSPSRDGGAGSPHQAFGVRGDGAGWRS
jgi:PAS domain S-box-containing protein